MEFRTRGRAKRKKAPHGSKAAKKILSRDELLETLGITEKAREQLIALSEGKTHRHAATVLAATNTILAYTVGKPKQEIEISGSLGERMRELEAAERARLEAQAKQQTEPEPES